MKAQSDKDRSASLPYNGRRAGKGGIDGEFSLRVYSGHTVCTNRFMFFVPKSYSNFHNRRESFLL